MSREVKGTAQRVTLDRDFPVAGAPGMGTSLGGDAFKAPSPRPLGPGSPCPGSLHNKNKTTFQPGGS